jgi:hypothetical protein
MPTKSLPKHFIKLVKIAQRFPGVEVETSWTPALKVKGKLMARLRTEAEGWLALRCEFVDREILLQAAPHVFHLTKHYVNYPMILVDLAAIDAGALSDVVERAWRKVAPKTLVREWDEQNASGSSARTPDPPARSRRAPRRARAARPRSRGPRS